MDYINRKSGMKLVDEDTGAVLDFEIRPGDTVRVIRQESIEAAVKLGKETVPLNKGRRFVKLFPDAADRLCKVLSPNEIWLLNLLLPYVGVNSGILRHRNGRFLSRAGIVEICEGWMSRPTVDRTLSDLVQHGVLAKCYVRDIRAYIANPYIVQNGSRANATLLALFKDGEWK